MIIRSEARFNPKQEEANQVLANPDKKFIMLYGGSRSGKTYQAVHFIRIRCLLYPGSKHLISRYSFANAKKTIWIQTILPEFKPDEQAGLCKINDQAGIIRYGEQFGGSMVILGGLEPSRIDAILAAEYGTIHITEANENRYEVVENLVSRLNDTSVHRETQSPIPLKFIIDLNPTVTRHWTNVCTGEASTR